MNNLLQTHGYETKRLAELTKYNILDTVTEKEYEEVAFLASVICQVPMALLSFVDKNRQWFKASVGFNSKETERVHSFCHHAIQQPKEIMVVEDARTDARFKNNPFVIGEPNIVFYAGIPLFNRQGYGLGTICVIDMQPRKLNERQRKALQILSIQVMHLLELRRLAHEANTMRLQPDAHNKNREQFAGLFSNCMSQPLGSVLGTNELLKSLYN